MESQNKKSIWKRRTLPDIKNISEDLHHSQRFNGPGEARATLDLKRPVDSISQQREDERSLLGSTESIIFDCREVKVIDIHGVRIRPSVVRFDNTFENQSFTETVSVQNISENSVNIRIHNPRAWSFRVIPLDQGYQLAPGLKVSRRLHYTCTKNGIVQSTLPIYINEDIFELPLQAYKGQAFVEIIPTSINFGQVDIGCKPVVRNILIKNVSFCATKFLVDLGSNELELHVTPMKGWIRPHSHTTITLQLLALKEGIYSSELWITTDLCQTRIQVEVEACRRNLMVLHPNTISDFTLVDFPLTFYGCRRYQTVVVYNMAASSSAFVVLADFGENGLVPFREAQKGEHPNVKMFEVEPVEGRIRPFEERIFTLWFNPKIIEGEKTGWKAESNGDITDYLCAIKIKRIQVDDYGTEPFQADDKCDSLRNSTVPPFSADDTSRTHLEAEPETTKEVGQQSASLSRSLLEEISVLLYLYGEAEVPSLSVIPDAIHFPRTRVGTTVVKVLQITNNTNQMIAFQYRKIPFFKVTPDFKKLAPKTTHDVAVKLHATNIGVLKRNLTFEMFAQENATDKQNFHMVGEVTVRILGDVMSQKAVPAPKFNPGITPMITHEVGFLTDEVTFASKIEKPRGAIAAASERKRPWHHTNAIIAFPNDRPLTLRPRLTDKFARTIYKGLARYIPPIDESFTYTMEKLIRKNANDEWFLKYIRGTAALSVSKECCRKLKNAKLDPDPPVVFFEEKQSNLPREVFVPLTFVQLYRIRVYPPIISFGSVTTNKNCTQSLSIENGNDFKISTRIIPLTSGIDVQTLEHFIVQENSEAKVLLNFHRETLGRYSGTITCIVNGYHSFDIAVIAEVVHRSLTVTPEYVEVNIPDVPFANNFVPVSINNPLNIPITFSWIIPDESPIKIEPVIGVAPKRGSVWCVVYFEPENPNFKLHPIRLMVEETACFKLKTGVILPRTNVYFVESVLNLGYISMNITTVRRFFLFNPDFSDAMFTVLNKEPIKGVKVKPPSGTIRAKSCHSLTLHITVTTQKVMDFTIYINLQNSVTIEMRVVGTVVYPEVEITPKFINLHRVPCNSITRTMLIAENKSKGKAEVGFDMSEYPQFKVSLSKRHHDPGLSSQGITLEPGASQKFYLFFLPRDLASYDFYLPVVINNLITSHDSSNKDMEMQGRMIKGVIRALSLEGRVHSTAKGNIMSHLVLIEVVVLKALLVISDLDLFFSHTSETKSIEVKNISDQPIGIIIHSEDFLNNFDCYLDREEAVKDRSSFKLTVNPGDSIRYSATFTATTPGLIICDVSIQTTFEDHAYIYNTVRLTGSIPPPCVITSSVNQVCFQPVPLNVEVSFFFNLKISKSKNKERQINFEITGHHADLFMVEYPRGNTLMGASHCTVPVKITFSSRCPVSVRKKASFTCGRDAECFVTLIATADSCLLTTYSFLKAHSTPHQPRLKAEEDVLVKSVQGSNEKTSPPKQPRRKSSAQVKESSSGSSCDQSAMSLQTFSSGRQSCKTNKRSAQPSQLLKRSVMAIVAEKHRNLISKSDLSLQISEKEERQPSKIESSMESGLVMKEDEELIFPMFPLDLAVSDHAVFMNKTRDAVQQWVYEQVFSCSCSPFLASHSFSSFWMTKKVYSLSSPAVLKNVFDVLERICGRRIRRYFTPIDKMPEDNIARALFTYNLYRQLVEFMEAQGAMMAHVEPKYLMVYEEYCTYQNTRVQGQLISGTLALDDLEVSELISAEKFFSISVQCWLDLFLQMFKTLVLAPAVGITYFIPVCMRRTTTQTEYNGSKPHHGKAEDILLTWLSHQFNAQRTVVWPNKSPPPRTVTNFDTDLEDGLVLTATTAAYCPYLNDLHFHSMCLHPTTISQAYHNTTCLCMAWDSIKLGFSITPRDFVQPNMVNMLLLVTHLYKVLPSYKPETTIAFKAILNASESQIVSLQNDEEVSITYHVEILPHSANFFLEDCQSSLVLKRKSKGQITVRYLARNTNKAEAILLLCGACMPPKFGRNYVFKLEGYPVKLPVSSSFNIISPQNLPLDTQIIVESPHDLDFKAQESYSYDLWIAYSEPQPENLNALCWANERKRKIPRRLFFTSNTLVVTASKKKNGSGELQFKVCCFSQIIHQFWLIFRNPEIGDFIVKLQVTPHRPNPVLALQVTVDPDTACNRSRTVQMPCRNLEVWSAVRMMFELTISPEEKDFWATYIESNVGFRLLQWMVELKKEKLNEELELLFKKSKTYKVTCSSKYISCTPIIHVPDVRSKSSMSVELHLDENTPSHSTVLHLTTQDGHEIRSYNLKVVIIDKKKSL